MKFEDFKKQKSARVLAEHELDDDALEKLIEGKFNRARAYHKALNEREDLFVEQD